MSVVGDNIRALRTLFGADGRDLTQAELADIAGVTRETVNKWESGAIGNVRTANINRLREYFDLSVDDLRSESTGLAAKLRSAGREEGEGRSAEATVPVVPLDETLHGLHDVRARRMVEVPVSIASRHPRSFAFVVEYDDMARVLPRGCHAVVDPDVLPQNGSVVVADVCEGREAPVVRRLFRGSDKAMLSSDGFGETGDLVVDAKSLRVVGTVVWYQAAKELA